MTEPESPRLLLDEMLSGTIAAQLRIRGLDVVAVIEDSSLISTPDENLLAHATTERRILVTANISDFAAIANDWRTVGRTHHGLVYIANRAFRQDRWFVGSITNSLAALCQSKTLPLPGGEVFLTPLADDPAVNTA